MSIIVRDLSLFKITQCNVCIKLHDSGFQERFHTCSTLLPHKMCQLTSKNYFVADRLLNS